MARLILDSGAVIALAHDNAAVRTYVELAIERQILVVVPAVVVAETIRGGPRDAPVNQVLKRVKIAPVTEETARLAGSLRARVEGQSDVTVDALVVAEAVLGDSGVVLTGDPDDLSALAVNYPRIFIHGLESLS